MQIENGNAGSASATEEPAAPQEQQFQSQQVTSPQIPEPMKPANFKAHYIIGIIFAVLLIAVISYLVLQTHLLIQTTTTVPVTVKTTVPPNSNVYINLQPNSSLKTTLLFGILNASKYSLLLNDTIRNFTLGADNITANIAVLRIYGLNFTKTLVESPVEFPPSYNLSIPKSYANYMFPIMTSIFAYNESNVSEAVKFYDYERKDVVFGNYNISLPVYNKTVYYASNFSTSLVPKPGYNYTTIDSEYDLPNSVPGLNLTAISITPFYQNTEWYIIQAQYHNYFIIFSYYGVLHHFNQSTALRIAMHYINTTI